MPYFTFVKYVLPLKFPSLDFVYLKDISAMYKWIWNFSDITIWRKPNKFKSPKSFLNLV